MGGGPHGERIENARFIHRPWFADECDRKQRLHADHSVAPRPTAPSSGHPLHFSPLDEPRGNLVTGMERPKTIHDFGGFPQALFDVIYPAPGSPALAQWVCDLVKEPLIQVDLETWGLDHGTWSILCHLYPRADIPVLQLSLDLMKPGSWHFALGEKLRPLREQGILIMGSGNLVHNLRKIRWEADAEPLAWAVECDEWMKAKILARDFAALVKDPTKSDAGKLSIPTAEHYLPMLYAAGASTPDDQCRFEFEGLQNGSISMRSVSFGMPA